jgi:hypothetical protein
MTGLKRLEKGQRSYSSIARLVVILSASAASKQELDQEGSWGCNLYARNAARLPGSKATALYETG